MPATPPIHSDPRPLAERPLHEAEECRNSRARRTVTVHLAESPLAWLHARGHLNDVQLLAGEKLRGDYERAALGPKVAMRWEQVPRERKKRGPMRFDATEHMVAAKERFDTALSAIGPDLSDIAWRVICAGESVPIAERALAWPVRSGKLVLRIALDRLAEFYRLPGT